MSDNIEKPTVNDEISKEKGVNEKVKVSSKITRTFWPAYSF